MLHMQKQFDTVAEDQLIESKAVVIQHVPWVYYELLLLLKCIIREVNQGQNDLKNKNKSLNADSLAADPVYKGDYLNRYYILVGVVIKQTSRNIKMPTLIQEIVESVKSLNKLLNTHLEVKDKTI